jgi:Domain of unknown function (DUF202)
MADPRTATGAGRFEVKATASDHFAWVRTRLALERTIMSWLQTAVALIGFGFAIVQYMEHLQQLPGARPRPHRKTTNPQETVKYWEPALWPPDFAENLQASTFPLIVDSTHGRPLLVLQYDMNVAKLPMLYRLAMHFRGFRS